LAVLKKIAGMLFGKDNSEPSADGFFLKVRCSECGEQFNLFINKSYELMQNFEADGRVTYALKKVIYGVGCRNRIHVSMKFNSQKKLLTKEIENGEYIEDDA
jgi:hypothetical protein